jgi:hypothetical protein
VLKEVVMASRGISSGLVAFPFHLLNGSSLSHITLQFIFVPLYNIYIVMDKSIYFYKREKPKWETWFSLITPHVIL